MDSRKVATWLANPTGEGASDEEFAETIVLAYKIWKTGNPRVELTKEDMINADIETITSDIEEILAEVIFSDEMDSGCWWKDNTDG